MAAIVASEVPTYDINELPSVKDGMSVQEEATKRKKTSRFIEEACRILKLPRVATATALVFFHRFYAKHSFGKHDRFEVAVACILLAAKTEESPRKVVNVLEECHKLRSRAMAAGRMNNQGNSPSTTPSEPLDPKGEEFTKLKERILLLERVVLHTIGFELSVDHPYKFIVDRIKLMIQRGQIKYTVPKPGLNAQQSRDKLMNEVVQFAMNFANDSFQTSLCIQFPAEDISRACIFLGGQFAKTDADWPTVLEISDVEGFASICVQLLELISEKKGSDQAAFRAMRAELEKLRIANAKFRKNAPPHPSPKRARIN
mmetsp:Transcript_1908/g.2646  ORF Transcript_1908/g.2646 Transcript_1908/m.2646 type:complete len:315 (+) Transcript_1908:59-1003(+)